MQSVSHNRKLSTSQIIIFGFLLVVLIGSFILMLPISSRAGTITPFWDCLFTSTSAVCVTGLVVYVISSPERQKGKNTILRHSLK